MAKYRSKTIITIGFSTILVLLIVLIAVWLKGVYDNSNRLHRLVDKQNETRQLSDMRDAAYRRAITIYRMLSLEDPFDRDEEYILFRELGSNFMVARDKLLKSDFSPGEKLAWENASPLISKGGQTQSKAVELAMEEKTAEAEQILRDEAMPIQDIVMEKLSLMFDAQRDTVEKVLEDATRENQTTYILIILLGTVALMLGVFMIFVVRRTGTTEAALVEQGERIRALYQVSTMPGLSLHEQVSETLKLGCRLLGMDYGKVCKIDLDNNTNTSLNAYGFHESDLIPGSSIDLDKTYCDITFIAKKPIAFHNVTNSPYKIHPCYKITRIKAYIATTIILNGKKFGTISFSSKNRKKMPFSETDKDLVSLIGSWVSVSLEREFAQMELEDARDKAEEANRTKSAFLANVSHELRTPLNAIIGYSELLHEEAEDSFNSTSKGFVSDIDKINLSGQHLLALINDILDLSKIEAGKMELNFEYFSFKSVLNDVVETIKPLLKANNNTLRTVCSDDINNIYSDSKGLKQILLNLLGNAGKFTSQGTISLVINKEIRSSKPWILISVKDDGIGMTKDQVARLFQAFSQVDAATTTKYGGTGLGLAISRRICELMGGEIEVNSKLEYGSTFTVRLPIHPIASEKPLKATANNEEVIPAEVN